MIVLDIPRGVCLLVARYTDVNAGAIVEFPALNVNENMKKQISWLSDSTLINAHALRSSAAAGNVGMAIALKATLTHNGRHSPLSYSDIQRHGRRRSTSEIDNDHKPHPFCCVI